MNGLVVKNTGNDVWVRFADGQTKTCKVKGNFRIRSIRSTNPVVVGDIVELDGNNQISNILPRKNHIARRPVNLSRQIHIIAANIDVALLVVTLRNPETSLTFIDRFIASAEAYSVDTILVFNKLDILDKKDNDELQHIVELYEKIGYRCIKTIATQNIGLTEIKAAISGKIALLSGNSGVGKSTLINSILGYAGAKTAEISAYHHKGMHTTTFSEIYCLSDNTYIIDTPGIKGFGRNFSLFRRDICQKQRVPLSELHTHSRTRVCRQAGGRRRSDSRQPLYELPVDGRRGRLQRQIQA